MLNRVCESGYNRLKISLSDDLSMGRVTVKETMLAVQDDFSV
jgi:hypothetical protein